MLWLPSDLRLEVLRPCRDVIGQVKCSGRLIFALDAQTILHFLCQESSGELTLPPWHYCTHSAWPNQSLWLCFSFFPVLWGEEGANWDTDWGTRNLHFWMSLLIMQGQSRGSFEQLHPTCGYSHPSLPWPSSPGETRTAGKRLPGALSRKRSAGKTKWTPWEGRPPVAPLGQAGPPEAAGAGAAAGPQGCLIA